VNNSISPTIEVNECQFLPTKTDRTPLFPVDSLTIRNLSIATVDRELGNLLGFAYRSRYTLSTMETFSTPRRVGLAPTRKQIESIVIGTDRREAGREDRQEAALERRGRCRKFDRADHRARDIFGCDAAQGICHVNLAY